MSPFIFILVAEVLSSLIRQNEKIRGIQLGCEEVKLTQFADDTTCMLENEASLEELLTTLQTFEKWSGLKINKKKTQILYPAGARKGTSQIKGMPIVVKAKILGIWLSTDSSEETRFQYNFRPILDKIRNVCDSWSMRGLSIKGKITVANSLLVSLLQYPCSIIHTPERVYKEYKQAISAFL